MLIVFFFYYESKGLSLEQIDLMYNDPKCKPWNSAKWVPPGHKTRSGMPASEEGEVVEGVPAGLAPADEIVKEERDALERHFDEEHYARNDDMYLQRERTVESFWSEVEGRGDKSKP